MAKKKTESEEKASDEKKKRGGVTFRGEYPADHPVYQSDASIMTTGAGKIGKSEATSKARNQRDDEEEAT